MTISITKVESLRVIVESTFCGDRTGSIGSYVYVPMIEGSAELALNLLEDDPNHTLQSRIDYREMVLGPRQCGLKFTLNLAPTGTAASSAVTAITSALGIILKAVLGGEHLGTGTTFTGGTALIPNVTSAAGLVAGGWIGWANTSGTVEWRQIKAINTLAVTLTHGFSGAPANTNVCYSCATYYMTENPLQSLQFIVAGQNTNDRWLAMGVQCVGGFDIKLDPSGKGIPTITFTMQGALYYDNTQTAGSITGTLADATYTAYNPIVEYVGDHQMFTVGTPTYTATASRVHVSALTFKPSVKYIAVTSPSAAGAALGGAPIYQWQATAVRPPIEGSFTTFFEDLKWWQKRAALADMCMQYTTGIVGGSAVVLAAPTVQVLNPQRGASDQEIEGQTVMWKGRRNTDTALTTEIAKSPVVIVLG